MLSFTFVAVESALAIVTGDTAATMRPFPFLYDVGGGNASQLQWAHNLVPRVELGKIFECPHPCGLLPSFDQATGKVVIIHSTHFIQHTSRHA